MKNLQKTLNRIVMPNKAKHFKSKQHKALCSFAIVTAIVFSTLVFTGVESYAFDSPQVAAQKLLDSQKKHKQTTVVNKNFPLENASKPVKTKRSEFKYTLLKFLSAMAGVFVSVLAIFFGLKIYKKFVLKANDNFDNINYDKTLESPKDFKEAINLFLDKTDK